uniref:single-stranded DNA cytosine deaminase n=1 Tax=Sus scrofa TaxID=9823 RepID=A0A8D0ZI99_PIG
MDPQRLRQWPGPGPASRGGYGQRPRIRNPEEWFHELSPRTFSFHFRNLRFASGRNRSYICCQVEGKNCFFQGIFQNQKKRHAEIRFIDKINSLNLDQNQCYRIICYVTWSPCHNCAKELVDFISNRHHLSLQLFASRLYFHWVRCYQRGLQRLQANRVSVAVMKGPEFKDCWEKFVDHQGESFPSWEKLEQYSESISRRLSRILRFANQNNLEDSFRDLRLGSPSPSSSRSDSR